MVLAAAYYWTIRGGAFVVGLVVASAMDAVGGAGDRKEEEAGAEVGLPTLPSVFFTPKWSFCRRWGCGMVMQEVMSPRPWHHQSLLWLWGQPPFPITSVRPNLSSWNVTNSHILNSEMLLRPWKQLHLQAGWVIGSALRLIIIASFSELEETGARQDITFRLHCRKIFFPTVLISGRVKVDSYCKYRVTWRNHKLVL